MKLKTPLKSSFAVLAVAASLVSASTAWSQSDKRQAARDKINASRRAVLVGLSKSLVAMCGTVRGWNIKTPNPPTGAEECKNNKGMDCDMPGFGEDPGGVKKESFRAKVDAVRKACDEGLNGPQSLAPLLEEGASLYRIPTKPAGDAEDGVWGELTDNLAEAVNYYDGSTLGGPRNYLERMKSGKKAEAILQLATDEHNYFVAAVNDDKVTKDPSVLHRAVKAIAEPKKADGK